LIYNINNNILIKSIYKNIVNPNIINLFYNNSDYILTNINSINISNYFILSITINSNLINLTIITGDSIATIISKDANGKVKIGVWVGFAALIMGSLL
jgi:hypothetical protein